MPLLPAIMSGLTWGTNWDTRDILCISEIPVRLAFTGTVTAVRLLEAHGRNPRSVKIVLRPIDPQQATHAHELLSQTAEPTHSMLW